MCRASIGIFFKLLCPGDVPTKAHKLILNSTIAGYEEFCYEEHHVEVVYSLWQYDYTGYPLLGAISIETRTIG